MSTIERRLAGALVLSFACDSDLEFDDDEAAGFDASVAIVGTTRSTVIDASRDDTWIYLDLESATQSADAAALASWDVAFQRFKVMLNGGVSSPGSALVSVLMGQAFADVKRAPEGGYFADLPDGSDTDLEPDYAISVGPSAWYEYNSMNHTLAPRPHVYVVRSVEGAFFKLALLGYYNAAGSSGYPSVQWEQVEPAATVSLLDAGAAATDAMTSASAMTDQ